MNDTPTLSPTVQPMASAATQAGMGAAQLSEQFAQKMATQNQQLESQNQQLMGSIQQMSSAQSLGMKAPPLPKTVTAQQLAQQKAPQNTAQVIAHSIGMIIPSLMGAIVSSSSGGAGAAMGSMFALHGFYTALNQGNMEKAKEHAAKTKELLEEAQQHNQAAFAKYNAILKQGQLNMEQKLAALKEVAMQLHDNNMEMAANEGNIMKAAELSAKMQEASQKLQLTAASLQEKMSDDQAKLGISQQRLGISAQRAATEEARQNELNKVIEEKVQNGGLTPGQKAEAITKEVNAHNNQLQKDYAKQLASWQKQLVLNPKAPPPAEPNYTDLNNVLSAVGISQPTINKLALKGDPEPETAPAFNLSTMKVGVPYHTMYDGKPAILIKDANGKITVQ